MLTGALDWAEAILEGQGEALATHTVLRARPERIVARLETRSGKQFTLKVDASAGIYDVEADAAMFLAAQGLPVAAPFAIASGPPALLLLPYQFGEGLNRHTPVAQQRQCGTLLRRVHDLRGGRPPPDGQTWVSWMRGWLVSNWQFWQRADPSVQQYEKTLVRWWDRLEPLLATRGQHLILNDGRPEHFIVYGETVHLIDVAELRAGDAWMDLAVIDLWGHEFFEEFMRGYAASTAESEIGQRLLPFYSFLRALSAARWCAEHGCAEGEQAAFMTKATELLQAQATEQ